MRRERVADDIYIFTSELYAQVTAGAVITSEGAILIDTLVFPEEAKAIRNFIENRLSTVVRYVINTHSHADHTYGTCFFEQAIVVSHALCYDLLNTSGREGLQKAQQNSRTFQGVTVRLPQVVFEQGELELRLGEKTLVLQHSPGHSEDGITVLVKEDRILFAGDTVMPVPYFVNGNYDDFMVSLEKLRDNNFENIVQGHGEVILRGEIESKIESDLAYLRIIRNHVEKALLLDDGWAYLEKIDIEKCGKSRIPLNGGVQDLHRENLRTLFYRELERLQTQNSESA